MKVFVVAWDRGDDLYDEPEKVFKTRESAEKFCQKQTFIYRIFELELED